MTSAANLAARIAARPLGASGLPPELLRAYDLERAVAASFSGAVDGLEGEVHQELLRQEGSLGFRARNDKGSLLIPPGALYGAALQTGTAGGGQELVHPSVPGSFSPGLRPVPVVVQLGATVITDAPAGVRLPRFSAGLSPVWITPEVPETDQSDTPPTTAGDAVVVRLGQVSTSWSRQIQTQQPELRPLLTRDVYAGAAALLDQAALVGSGTDGEPLGLLNRSTISTVAMGAPDGGAITWPKVLEIEETAHEQEGRAGWATTKRVRRILRNLPEIGSGGRPVWRDGKVLDYPALASSHMPSDLQKGEGENLHGLLFSSAWEHLVVQIVALELVVDPYTRAGRGLVTARLYLHGGVGLVHPESFVRVLDITGTIS